MSGISAGLGAGEVAGVAACDASWVLITTKYYVYSINNGLEILERKQKLSPSPLISEKPCDKEHRHWSPTDPAVCVVSSTRRKFFKKGSTINCIKRTYATGNVFLVSYTNETQGRQMSHFKIKN